MDQVRWGNKPAIEGPGVYLISTSADRDTEGGIREAPIDAAAVRTLLGVRPDAKVDGVQATEASVIRRLKGLWVQDEPVVYIGLAGTSVSKRVSQYYSTRIGARAPHAGAWPLKMLRDLDRLWVHTAACSDPGAAEISMLEAFASGCNGAARSALHDPNLVLPYANLELTKGQRKQHGFTGVKEPRSTSRAAPVGPPPVKSDATATSLTGSRPLVTGSALLTQNITAGDIDRGQIRVPSRTKRAFPAEKAAITIELGGERIDARWDPKFGPDKERSGVVAVGKSAMTRLTRPRGPMKVAAGEVVRID